VNLLQKVILVVGVGLFVWILLYPPTYTVFIPPRPGEGPFAALYRERVEGVRVDHTATALRGLAIAASVAVAYAIAGDGRSSKVR